MMDLIYLIAWVATLYLSFKLGFRLVTFFLNVFFGTIYRIKVTDGSGVERYIRKRIETPEEYDEWVLKCYRDSNEAHL
jgi:hypothetical protein